MAEQIRQLGMRRWAISRLGISAAETGRARGAIFALADAANQGEDGWWPAR